MRIIRWIFYIPLGVVTFLLCLYVIPYILGFIWKILYFVMFWGSRYDFPPIFDFEYAIEDFKTFIFTTCLGTIIAGGIAGGVAGFVAPKSGYSIVATIIYTIAMFILLLLLGYGAWNSEHWFYSICMEITFIITGVFSIAFMYSVNNNDL